MKVSEFIEALQKVLEENGDLELVVTAVDQESYVSSVPFPAMLSVWENFYGRLIDITGDEDSRDDVKQVLHLGA